ncbi:hypothetical protein P3X46_025722 [Hevea brasiliensis]|uniref:NB-ARC domain-containing protein n=1 Tax=Hevea brasiliensis TaxID=3981 RepID=A0ABQ9L6F4_HEVBR|nr:hypothetical protein P3X46_025722 [Hevea brasiliensis]
MEVLGSIFGEIGGYLVKAIKRRFGYCIHYHRNVETLKKQVQILEATRKDVEASTNTTKRNGEVIRNEVQNWTSTADGALSEATKFLQAVEEVRFLDFISRYRLGRKAAKKAMAIEKLKKDGEFDRVANHASPPGVLSMPSQDFVIFESTRNAMEKIMEALKDEGTNFIGIHGMGGIGKTTIVKDIAKKVEQEKLFDAVVMAVVSQTISVKRIQEQIAEMLGLDFKQTISEEGRASLLHTRLKNENKTLVILDDIWVRLDLAIIGIPFGNGHIGCKIMITTRRRQVCNVMASRIESTKIIQLDVLAEQESWFLLKRNAGDVIESSPTMNSVAKDICKECGGLPLAIVTVGRAMRGRDLEEWKEAALELKKAQPVNIEGMDDDVYKCLKLSYDYLKNKETKFIFLFCCLFPEDYDIPMEDLVRYGIGLGIFEDVRIQEARNRARFIVNNLKESCLFLTSNEEDCVKMHDVVRDVAKSITSDMYFVKVGGEKFEEWPNIENLKRYTALSIMQNQIPEYPASWDFPNLQTLLLRENRNSQLAMPEGVLKGMKTLELFDHSGSYSHYPFFVYPFYGNLEPTLSHLTNLRTLILQNYRVGDTTALGGLKSLEILSFKGSIFTEPANAISKLTSLKLLDLEECSHHSHMDSILPSNVISRLSRVQELYMWMMSPRRLFSVKPFMSFNITELKPLARLTAFTMMIVNFENIPEGFCFPDLEVFKISIGDGGDFIAKQNYLNLCGLVEDQKMLAITRLGCIKPLLPRTNYLSLSSMEGLRNIFPQLISDRDSLAVLRSLNISSCSELEYLIDAEEWEIPPTTQQQQGTCLVCLETLSVSNLKALEALCKGELPYEISLSMTKLKLLRFYQCSKLSNVFASLNPQLQLKELEVLHVGYCNALEYIFGKKEDAPPCLRELKLDCLMRLKRIYKCSTDLLDLCNLEVLQINRCNELKVILPASAAQRLGKLKELHLDNCYQLEAFLAKQQEGEETIENLVFSQLRMLSLVDLPNLTGFCTDYTLTFKWPSLEKVEVVRCPKMQMFVAVVASDEDSSMPKLKMIKVDGVDIMLEGTDINRVMQGRYKDKVLVTDH